MNIPKHFDWKTYSWIKRGPRRKKVLHYLSNMEEPVTATNVRKVQKVDITQAACTLSELWNRKLLHCLNSDDHHGKLFIITKKGKAMLRRLK